jgi:hypothetical protein
MAAVASTLCVDYVPGDDRQAPRYRLLLKATAKNTSGSSRGCLVHDLSTHGFLIETDAPLELGSDFALDLPGLDNVEAQIVWNEGNHFGGRFRAPLPRAALDKALRASVVSPTAPVDHDPADRQPKPPRSKVAGKPTDAGAGLPPGEPPAFRARAVALAGTLGAGILACVGLWTS